jgi:hypothetical protein
VSLVKRTLKSGSIVVIQNLFCNFWTLLQVSKNFGSLKQFLELKTIEKRFKNGWASNRSTARGVRAKPARVRWHDGLLCGPIASSARPALPPSTLSVPSPWSPRTERPGRRSRRQPVSGLGAAAPAAGAPDAMGNLPNNTRVARAHRGGGATVGGSGRHGELTSGGPGRQRRRRDGGGRQSGGALVREQGMGRR